MKWLNLGASPLSSSWLVGNDSIVEQGVIRSGYIHVLVMHGMSSLIYSLSLINIEQRRTLKPAKSRVRLWAPMDFELLNSISIPNL